MHVANLWIFFYSSGTPTPPPATVVGDIPITLGLERSGMVQPGGMVLGS